MSEPMKFSLKLKKERVAIEDEDGKTLNYDVCEMSGSLLEGYLDDNKNRVDVEIVDGKVKVRKINSYKGLFASLLSRSMRDESGSLVPVEKINAMPYPVQRSLFEIAQKVNGLSESSEDEAKN